MSCNLCTDKCVKCGYRFDIGDFRGKPLEFRRSGKYPPVPGVKLVCSCGMVYFGWYRHDYQWWSEDSIDYFDKDKYPNHHGRLIDNEHKGKFANRFDDGKTIHLGYYKIDISYYEAYSDEGEGVDDPSPHGLFTEHTDELTRWDY